MPQESDLRMRISYKHLSGAPRLPRLVATLLESISLEWTVALSHFTAVAWGLSNYDTSLAHGSDWLQRARGAGAIPPLGRSAG